MKRILPFVVFCFISLRISAQDIRVENKYEAEFNAAYAAYPNVPRGMLEAVSFTMTRFNHIQHISGDVNDPGSCTGLPKVYGVMGLTLDGQNYFRNNLNMISGMSGYSIADIISSPLINIKAFAKAYQLVLAQKGINPGSIETHSTVLNELSELPVKDIQTDFALNSYLYSVYSFLSTPEYQTYYGFPDYHLNLPIIFGENNYKVLSAPGVTLTDHAVIGSGDRIYQPSVMSAQSTDYGPALWVASPNFNTGRTMPISVVIVHDIEGTYASCISWFQNTASQVSAHYVARSSDGQITQMVLESDKAWHVGSENAYCIGIEHEGYVATGNTWYTKTMLNSTALMVKTICGKSYGINPIEAYYGPGCTGSTSACLQSTCTVIKGHQMLPNQTHTDPGVYWDWAYYYLQINSNPKITTMKTASGNFYDSGGPTNNYSNSERTLTLMAPPGASSVTLTFKSFATQAATDHLILYDGITTAAPVIGSYSGTTSPGTITASSGALLAEFRSDCSTTAAGWSASYTSKSVSTGIESIASAGSVTIYPNPANEQVTIDLNGFSGTVKQIEIYDRIGRELVTLNNCRNESIVIPISDFSSGLYIIRLITDQGVLAKRLEVNK